MTNKKSTKRALLVSLLAMLLSVTMLVGTTFAWFTDSVTSSGNIIKSGTLDLKVSVADEYAGTYTEIDKTKVFDYDKWEPGYTEVNYIKIENVGSLSFKYMLNIIPEGAVSDLADVLDVYYIENVDAQIDKADMLDSARKVGTLREFINKSKTVKGVMLAELGDAANNLEDGKFYDGAVTVAIAVKMREEAGNEYMNMSLVGGKDSNLGFDLQFVATQFTSEEDAFDFLYDATAEFDEIPDYAIEAVDVATLPAFDQYDLTTFNKTNNTVKMQVAYNFIAQNTYEEAQLKEYAKWHADFVITVNKDVAANSLGLGGSYPGFENISFDAPVDVKAGEEIRLLGSVGFEMNYEEICRDVQTFLCGMYNNSADNIGTVMTVELRMYEVEEPSASNGNSWNVETGRYITVGSFSHTITQ